MIVFRYFARAILTNTVAVTAVLLLVIVSSRFVKYLAEAAAGKLDPAVLFAIIGFRLPEFLELILPLAFFLSILLAYGQLYVDSEMTVLRACGMGEGTVIRYTLLVALLIAALVAILSLVASPAGLSRAEALVNAQKQRGEIESLTPGRFYSLRAGRGTTYAEDISDDGRMHGVFLAQSGDGDEAQSKGMVVVVAEHGYSRQSEQTGERYLVLENGLRVQGTPGRADYQLTRFAEFGQRLDSVKPWELRAESEAMSTMALINSDDPEHRATVQWRISLPVMVLVVALMAVPLSRTNPRQGKFVKVLPAILLYVLYLLSLNAARGALEEGALPPWAGMLWVHGLFLLIALALVGWNSGWRRIAQSGARGGGH
ncbi:MAG: LPS export ABC transporter permease LptF [Porticoccaceae bacterium]|nr:LPS export ABC transporter permease LptF [Porticoccaceae bacterium]